MLADTGLARVLNWKKGALGGVLDCSYFFSLASSLLFLGFPRLGLGSDAWVRQRLILSFGPFFRLGEALGHYGSIEINNFKKSITTTS